MRKLVLAFVAVILATACTTGFPVASKSRAAPKVSPAQDLAMVSQFAQDWCNQDSSPGAADFLSNHTDPASSLKATASTWIANYDLQVAKGWNCQTASFSRKTQKREDGSVVYIFDIRPPQTQVSQWAFLVKNHLVELWG